MGYNRTHEKERHMIVFRYLIDLLIIVLSTLVLTIATLAYAAPETLGKLGCAVTNHEIDNYYCKSLDIP